MAMTVASQAEVAVGAPPELVSDRRHELGLGDILWPNRRWVDCVFYGEEHTSIAFYKAGRLIETVLLQYAGKRSLREYYAPNMIIDPLLAASTCETLALKSLPDVFQREDVLEMGSTVHLQKVVGKRVFVPPIEAEIRHIVLPQPPAQAPAQAPAVPPAALVEEPPAQKQVWPSPLEAASLPGAHLESGQPRPRIVVPQTFEELRLGILRGLVAHAITLGDARFIDKNKGGYDYAETENIVRSQLCPILSTKYSAHAESVLAYSVAITSESAPPGKCPPHEVNLPDFASSIANCAALVGRRERFCFVLVVRTLIPPVLCVVSLEVEKAAEPTGDTRFEFLVFSPTLEPPGLRESVEKAIQSLGAARIAVSMELASTAVPRTPLEQYGTTVFLMLLAWRTSANIFRPSEGVVTTDLARNLAVQQLPFGLPRGVTDPNELLEPGVVDIDRNASLYMAHHSWPHSQLRGKEQALPLLMEIKEYMISTT